MNPFVKPVVFLVSLLPLCALVYGAINNELGANPVETITHETGEWALIFLVLTLSMTPLQSWIKKPWPILIRRMLGLYAFFYACLHFMTYLWLDQFFDWPAMLADLFKRPYIAVGFAALVVMIPLALTSNKFAIRKLGRRWRPLHLAVYPIAVLVMLHYVWLVKADLLEPAIYLLILISLLFVRLIKVMK